ncbi:RNB domain-containing ribonuclease [Variovorax sp. LT1P1]|uniref:RNB domain-containing ribonuclease n=1 Tax=Variovorax sp. LT1P1 TaxID=3443730 RepID=UPI003F463936
MHQLITIDGATSRDLDDAISFAVRPNGGLRLVVAIADPTDLVTPGTALDLAARAQVATVYRRSSAFARMLPPELSEHDGSLIAGVERPVFLFEIDLDDELDVLAFEVSRGRATVAHRLSHDDVPVILAASGHPLHTQMAAAARFGTGMLQRRRRGGALAVYDLQRLVVANEEGRLVQLSRAEEVLGHIIVQEAMVLVNTLAARFMVEHDVPGLYRNHVPRPASPPVRDLAETLDAWIKSGELDIASARAQFHAIVGKASYGATTLGHISLATPQYTHVTSPLRRYADLTNLRQIRAQLEGSPAPCQQADLARLATHINDTLTERDADRGEAFKEATARRADSMLARGAVGRMGAPELGASIKAAADNMPVELQVELAARLDAGTLGDKNLWRLLTMFPPEAPGLRESVERLFHRDPSRAIAFLEHAKSVGFIDGYTAVADAGPANGFVGRASARRPGEVFTGDSGGSSKRLAQQAAAVSCIRALLGWPAAAAGRVESLEREGAPGWQGNRDVECAPGLEPMVNAKGRLFERCQAKRWAAPEFAVTRSGQDHAPVFRCIATLVADGMSYEVIVEGADSRKEAEARASHLLLLKLEELPAVAQDDQVRAPRAETSALLNPVGALQEWAQKNKVPLPTYEIMPAKGGFVAELTMTTAVGARTFRGTGATKAEAKKASADAAFAELHEWCEVTR